MCDKYYILFRDGDIFEQLHWFIDNYIPASRQAYEHKYVKSIECWATIHSDTQGAYTWDNSFCFFDSLTSCPYITKDYIQVFYNPDTITIGELQ